MDKAQFQKLYSHLNGGYKHGVFRNTIFVKMVGYLLAPMFLSWGTYRILHPFNYESQFRPHRQEQERCFFFNLMK
jgi:hypothetical protein